MIDVPRVLAIGLRDLSLAVIVERVGGLWDSQFSLFFMHFRASVKNRSLPNPGISQRAAPQAIDSMGHETTNQYLWLSPNLSFLTHQRELLYTGWPELSPVFFAAGRSASPLWGVSSISVVGR